MAVYDNDTIKADIPPNIEKKCMDSRTAESCNCDVSGSEECHWSDSVKQRFSGVKQLYRSVTGNVCGCSMNRFGISLVFLIQLIVLPSAQSIPTRRSPSLAYTNANTTIRIDTHSHFIPGWYRELLSSRNISSGGLSETPEWNVTTHLEMNARYGIATSVLSVLPGAKLSENASVEEGRALARLLNEYAYNLTVLYPKSFRFFGALTLPDLDGAVVEAIYALDTLKAAGVVLEASKFGEVLGTTRYSRLYEVLNNRSTTVFVHPSNYPCSDSGGGQDREDKSLPPYVVEFLLDTTRAAANLEYRNVTKDYPNITFILAHSGGFLPFAATRVAFGIANSLGSPSKFSSYYSDLSNFYVDLAGSATETALPSTTAYFNDNRIIFGSDYPYSSEGMQETAEGLQNYAGLGAAAKERINYGNAHRLFKRFLV